MIPVLALDIAAKASGAAFPGPNGAPAFSTLRQKIEGDEFGPIGTAFRRWMLDLLTLTGATHVALEAPWIASGSRESSRPVPVRIPRLLIGLAFLAEQIADEKGVVCHEAAVSTVRKSFLGTGRPEDPKRAVRRQCELLGWAPKDEHQADAAALWFHAMATLDPTFRVVGRPLFAGGSAA